MKGRTMSELDKLEQYLRENGYEYTREDKEPRTMVNCQGEFETVRASDWHQIRVYENGYEVWDAICHFGSYGYEKGLLEIMGVIVDHETIDDSVEGWLTADDVIRRIERGNNA